MRTHNTSHLGIPAELVRKPPQGSSGVRSTTTALLVIALLLGGLVIGGENYRVKTAPLQSIWTTSGSPAAVEPVPSRIAGASTTAGGALVARSPGSRPVKSREASHPLLHELCTPTPANETGATAPPAGTAQRRAAYGTLAPLPPVAYRQMNQKGRMQLTTVCGDEKDPLRLMIILGGAEGAARAILAQQITDLTVASPFLSDHDDYFHLDHAIVTIVATEGPTVYYALLALKNGPGDVLREGTFTYAKDGGVSMRKALLDHLLGQGRALPEAARALLERPYHHVMQLPPQAVMALRNLKALCYFETVVNDESEAVATYYKNLDSAPYDLHPQLTGEKPSRVPVGFVYVAHPELRAQKTDEEVVLVSSCRAPITLASNALNPNHYTQREQPGGERGETAVLGTYRCAVLRCDDEPDSHPIAVPFFGGVHKDLIVYRPAELRKAATPHVLDDRQREEIFSFRRPLGARCSDDPVGSPTRIVTHVPYFYTPTGYERELSAFILSLRNTALLTGWSEVVITTNTDARTLVDHLMRDSAATGDRNTTTFFPAPPRSQLVVISFQRVHGNSTTPYVPATTTHQPLASLSQWHVVSAKGFFDVVHYTESDIPLSKTQLDMYCATVGLLEPQNTFLNFLRFEEVGAHQKVLNSPPAWLFGDAPRDVLNLTEVLVAERRRLEEGSVPNGSLLRPHSWMLDYRNILSQWQFAAPAGAVTVYHDKDGKGEKAQLATVHECLQLARTATVDGPTNSTCLILSKVRHGMWGINHVYSAMYLVPDSRISTLEGSQRSPWHTSDGLLRENVAYFRSPSISYTYGVNILHARCTKGQPAVASSNPQEGCEFPLSTVGTIPHNGKMHKYDDPDHLPYPIFIPQIKM